MNSFTLISILAISLGANGIPLESPAADWSQFFGSRIVGGVEAADNYAAYQAALVFGREQYPSLMCGASIVSDTVLLTAAHCIDPFVWAGELMETLHARVGSNYWSKGGDIVRFKGYKNHDQWDPFTIKYDIGVLYMREPLRLGERVAVIALNYEENIEAGERAFVTGWGRIEAWGDIPKKLQMLDVTTICPKECARAVVEASQGWAALPVYAHAEICTFHSVGHGMCNGDSGSALVSRRDGRQIGIVSWGFPCAVGAPDVFTRISGMRDFLQLALGRDDN